VAITAWALTLLLLPLARVLMRELLDHLGWWKLSALMVGSGSYAREAFQAIAQERHLGLQVGAIVTLEPTPAASQDKDWGVPMHSAMEGIEAVARRLQCSTIVVALDERDQSQLAGIVNALHPQQFQVFVVPPISGLPVQGMQAQHFLSNDTLLLRVQQDLMKPRSQFIKRSLDVMLSCAGLLALSPLLALVAWRIWREDGAPVLYRQPRVGSQGIEFELLKFRSMTNDADATLEDWKTGHPEMYQEYERGNFKLADDPRVLRVGRWIRRTSIDELPQLWNVVRGDMSLVGPRPLLARELGKYPDSAMDLYQRVKPGISGLWQVSGRSQTTFGQRALLDAWYVRNWSLWLDWVILLKTLRVVWSGRGAM
jgi:undecaprenyl-phosphate galactose phosphotransferase